MSELTFGTTYYSHANPSEELARNFRSIREMGIDSVRVAEIWPGWSVLEPSEGVYDFSPLDDYVAKARASGLQVCMGVGITDTPQWIYYAYPDIRFRAVDGLRTTRRVQAACFDHEEYRAHMERFIRTIADRYDGAPGVTSWQFGNEIRYGVSICDCEATRRRFRSWLKGRYGSLNDINRAWGTQYAEWEQIFPYRSQEGAPSGGIAPHCMKTVQFQRWSVEEVVRWGIGIMREHTALPIFHNNYDALGRDGSLWRLTDPADLSCIDIYANTADRPGFYNGLLLDVARSIATQQHKPLMVGETAVGQYGTYKRIPTDQRLVECCVVEQLAAGARTIFYFRHKAPKWEQPHKFTGSQTVLRVDESPMEYIKTPNRMTLLRELYGDRIRRGTPPRPKVALYYAEENVFFGNHVGYGTDARESLFGSRAVWNAQRIPVEIVDRRGVEEGILSHFDLVYLPVVWQLPRAVAKALADFAAAGGKVVAEGRPAYVDDDGLLYNAQPGGGLDSLFGCCEDRFWMDDTYPVMREDGRSFVLPYQRQSYRVLGGTGFLFDDEDRPVGVRNSFGEGTTWLIGGAPSMAFTTGGSKYHDDGSYPVLPRDQKERLLTLVGDIAEEAGIRSPFDVAGGDEYVTVRALDTESERLLFLINYSASDSQEVQFLTGSPRELMLDGETDGADRTTLGPLTWRLFSLPLDRRHGKRRPQ